MAENKGSPGLSKLARVISQRAENVAGKAERDLVLDFGSIKGDMSLLTNTFPIPIPRSDYHVCRLVGGLAYTISGGSHGGHEGGNGSHTHTVPPDPAPGRDCPCVRNHRMPEPAFQSLPGKTRYRWSPYTVHPPSGPAQRSGSVCGCSGSSCG